MARRERELFGIVEAGCRWAGRARRALRTLWALRAGTGDQGEHDQYKTGCKEERFL